MTRKEYLTRLLKILEDKKDSHTAVQGPIAFHVLMELLHMLKDES